MVRKLSKWTEEELSCIYWLTIWGYSNKEIQVHLAPVLVDKNDLAIKDQGCRIRRWITEGIGGIKLNKEGAVTVFEKKRFRTSAKIRPNDLISHFEEGKESRKFIPTAVRNVPKSYSNRTKSGNFQMVESNPPLGERPREEEEVEQKDVTHHTFDIDIDINSKTQGVPDLLTILIAARDSGVKSVLYHEYTFNFV